MPDLTTLPDIDACIRYWEEHGKCSTYADPNKPPSDVLMAYEIRRLRTRLLTAAGDDLCRLTQEEIKAMSAGEVKIPPKEEFLASCERFHAQVAGEAGVMTNCLTLAQLIAENERLKADLVAAKRAISLLERPER